MVNILIQLRGLAIRLIDAYQLILVVYFLMSWLPGAYQSKLGEILYRICEPYVGFFRKFVPPIGFISLAGIVALVALSLIQNGVIVFFNFLIRLFI
ncbi:YggT family protein [Atopostipes suicloacalis DSM 15692]|uniref:YggT family protein n=1 Tax=Atopostipes suicloacalis DSM 15692 TaxID=1121025 RepID=A0A1M4T0T6_9LACT|nr:YggT family protein [Atopostipes suicloacalis]SHE38035.1 YggT family protein [Atopostipes suicloacalis DSM 15692]